MSVGSGIKIAEAGRAAEALAGSEACMLEMVERCEEMLNDTSEDEILTYVCATYPGMAKNSAAYDGIKPYMGRHAMSMLRNQKITSGKAAEMLGQSIEYVVKKAARGGIRVLSRHPWKARGSEQSRARRVCRNQDSPVPAHAQHAAVAPHQVLVPLLHRYDSVNARPVF